MRYAVPLLLASTLAGTAHGMEAEVRMHQGRPALFVSGKPVPPFAYMSYLGKTPYYREVAAAGVHLYCFPAYLGDRGINTGSGIGPFRDAIWRGEGEYDFASMAGDFEALLRADPEALVVVRLHLDPPRWWEAAHPEACTRLPGGTTFRQCFSSDAWRAATADALRACIAWLLDSPYADHLIGVHVAAGHTEEWFYHLGDTFHDENPARVEAFRAWLRKAYANDVAALRAAWGNSEVTFGLAQPADISGGDRRMAWRAPVVERPVIDTLRFHGETMADNVAYFCRVVKEASRCRLLTGAFFGYHYFVGDARRGHGALGKLLTCPDLDYLSSPNVYHRVLGEDWPPMAAVASVQRHGKLWLAENDTRTHKTTLLKDQAPEICPPGQYESGVWLGPDTAADSVALVKKNAARMLAGGYGGWWFDMWGGWFSDPALMRVIQRTQELGALDLDRQGPAMAAQVAVVADESLCFHDASYGALTEEILGNRYALGRAGAPYDLFLLSDLPGLDSEAYRVIWLMTPVLDDALTAYMARRASAAGTTLWTGPAGTTLSRPDGVRVFAGKHSWSSEDLRGLWEDAGVHRYVDTDDVLYAGHGWLGLHGVEGGPRTVRLPFVARVTDAFSGVDIAASASRVEVELPPRSTVLLRVEPVE